MKRFLFGSGLLTATALALCAPAAAQTVNLDGGEVNISGATLFADFFFNTGRRSTNDWSDIDGDGRCANPLICGITFPADQLAENFNQTTCTVDETGDGRSWWLVQYRGVGSVRGLGEFVDYQLLSTIPAGTPTDFGAINRTLFYNFNAGGVQTLCAPPVSGGSPVAPSSIDLAVLDVPTLWAVRTETVLAGGGNWDSNPGDPGYGDYDVTSYDVGFTNKLESLTRGALSLNTDLDAPDEDTVYDWPVAFVPIAIIANNGTGIEDISVRDLQHHFVTGRRSNGENLIAATRDSGSGTRNGMMNSLGIDPSRGRGENLRGFSSSSNASDLGPGNQASNSGGSGVIENAVQNHKLSIGYTGLGGGSRAAQDASENRYEILNVIFDNLGGTTPVRPTIDSVLDNCDPDSGYTLGGPETFSSRGDVFDTDPNSATYVDNQAAADYLRNILDSVAAFEEPNNPLDPNDIGTFPPGYELAITYFLLGGLDCAQSLADGELFSDQAENVQLKEFIRANNGLGIGGDTPAFGNAGRVPDRKANPTGADYPSNRYQDGSSDGDYYNYFIDNPLNPTGGSLNGEATLNSRNKLAGDFDGDGDRDIDDTRGLLKAIDDPAVYATDPNNVSTSGNPVSPEIIGDFDGDGNLNSKDARYWADGLVLTTALRGTVATLDRAAGFTQVDIESLDLFGNANYFGTTLITGSYDAGDSRGDVAGGTPYPGAFPNGHDGVVDCDDIDYVIANYGDWSDLDQAQNIDLSADMNGDLVIDVNDVIDIVENILDSTLGDVDLDGDVDAADLAIAQGNLGMMGVGYCGGDVNGDGIVDQADLDIIAPPGCPNPGCEDGDLDGDCIVGLADLSDLLENFGCTSADACYDANADIDGDGTNGLGDLSALLEEFGTDCN